MSHTEINTGWRSVLTNGIVYRLVQTVFSEKQSKQLILDEFITPAGANCQILDMGCGPGNLPDFLPDNVNYVGFDVNPGYIETANQRFSHRDNIQFLHASTEQLMDSDQVADGSIDVVIIHGVLHHITDAIAEEMFALARKKLRTGGRMVVLEPVWFDGQSPLRKLVMQQDRGRNIKTSEGWETFFSQVTEGWAQHSSTIEQNLIRFYDLVVCRVTKQAD